MTYQPCQMIIFSRLVADDSNIFFTGKDINAGCTKTNSSLSEIY